MLIMGQTDGIGSQLFDQRRVSVMVFFCQCISFVKHILMTAHTPERCLFSVDDKSFVWITGKAAHAHSGRNLIICLISSLKSCFYSVQIWAVDLPSLCIWYIKSDSCTISRAAATGYFFALCIKNRIQYCKFFIYIFNVGNNLKSFAAAVTRLRCHLDTRTSIIFQIKMCFRHTDQIHAPVKSAVEGKVC